MVRVKSRYLILQLVPANQTLDTDIPAREIIHRLRDVIDQLYGDVGGGEIAAHVSMKYNDPNSRIYVLRLPQEGLTQTWFAASCVTEVKSVPVMLRALRVCGSERTLMKDLLEITQTYVNSLTNLTEDAKAALTDSYKKSIDGINFRT